MQKDPFPFSFMCDHTPYVAWSYSLSSPSCQYFGEVLDLMFLANFLSLDSYRAKLRFYKVYLSAHIYSLPDTKSKQCIAGFGLSRKQYTPLNWNIPVSLQFSTHQNMAPQWSRTSRIRLRFLSHCKPLWITLGVSREENRNFKDGQSFCTIYNRAVSTD